jgi:hypothetical protein
MYRYCSLRTSEKLLLFVLYTILFYSTVTPANYISTVCFCFLCWSHLQFHLHLQDDHGLTAVHYAAEYNQPELLQMVFDAVAAEDKDELVNSAPKVSGVTPLHRAAFADAAEATSLLLSLGANTALKGAAHGMTALHIAGAQGSVRVWALLVKHAGKDGAKALLQQQDGSGFTPTHHATTAGWAVGTKDPSQLTPQADIAAALASRRAATAIVTNPLCVQHHTCPPSQAGIPSAPPENIKRLQVLIDAQSGSLRGSDLLLLVPSTSSTSSGAANGNGSDDNSALRWVPHAKPAVLADVLRVHEWSYIRKVQAHCAGITSADPEDEESGFTHLDGDTAVSCETFNAALAAAGAACEAVDLVANRAVRNAFCPVRPPGHHAGPKGLVKGTEGGPDSHGFCILNNVSIAASYAMNRHRDTVKKVAIVDFGASFYLTLCSIDLVQFVECCVVLQSLSLVLMCFCFVLFCLTYSHEFGKFIFLCACDLVIL